MKAWQTVVTYESKLVKRNWLFRLFIAGSIGLHFGASRPVGDSAGNMEKYSVRIRSSRREGFIS